MNALSTRKKLGIAAVLAVLGIAGNYLALPVAFGVALIFGSIFSIIAVSLLGLWWGVGVAVIASSYSILLWNHPYALIIFCLEIFWIGRALKRGRSDLVLLDAVFWLTAGWPLVVLFYGGVMQLSLQATGIIILKQALNGIFNALVADILLDHTPIHRMLGGKERHTSYRRLVFQVVCIVPMFLAFTQLLYTNYRDVTTQLRDTGVRVRSETVETAADISYWMETYKKAAAAIAVAGTDYNVAPSEKLQSELKQINGLFPDFHNVFLADKNGTTVAFFPAQNERGESTIGLNFSDRPYFSQLIKTGKPVVSDVFVGRGGVFKPIFSVSVPVMKNGHLSHFGLGAINLDRLIERYENKARSTSMVYTLLDSSGKVVFSTDKKRKPLELLPGHKVFKTVAIAPEVSLLVPGATKNVALMQAWKGAYFISQVPLKESNWTLQVEYPVAPLQKKLNTNTISGLAVFAVLLVVLIFLAAAISRYLTKPLESLAHISADIPAKIENSEQLAWPQSTIAEVALLVSNFRETAAALGSMIGLMKKRFSLAASAGIGIWEWLIPEDQLTWDKQMYRLYGISEDGFAKKFDEWLNLMHPEDRLKFAAAMTKTLSGESKFDTDFRIILPDGEIRHIQANALVLHDAAGKAVHLIGDNWDITRLKQVERDLVAAKETAELAAKMKGDSLFLLEQEMDVRQQIEAELRKNAARLEEQFIIRQQAEDALQSKHEELVALNADLENRVTEEVRKNREKDGMLLHNEKLASIGQLAAGVAHEINNPMGFIMANLNTLKEYVASLKKYFELVDEKVSVCEQPELQQVRKELDLEYILNDLQPLLAESTEGAERVRRIVLDLKDFARPDEEAMHDADLNHLVESTINIVRNELKYVAQLDLQLGELPPLICHPQQINQVISNLLINAAHAIEHQGVITVKTWQEERFILLSITDTGRGIPPEICNRIFDPFFTTKPVGKGTGLGLSISYDIIKKHGGEITLESQVGVGTTFTVKLPIDVQPVVEDV